MTALAFLSFEKSYVERGFEMNYARFERSEHLSDRYRTSEKFQMKKITSKEKNLQAILSKPFLHDLQGMKCEENKTHNFCCCENNTFSHIICEECGKKQI